MPSLRRPVAVLSAAFVLATPAGALAQSAGDDQYQDPFGGSGGGSGGGGSAQPAPTPATPAAPSGTAAPSTPAPTAPTASASQAPAAQPAGQLPYTGSPVEAGLLAGVGAVLLAGGVGLRVRLREPA
jgi:hypothetical protein